MQAQLSGSSQAKLTQSCRETAVHNFVSDFKSLTESARVTGGKA
jgi:hypothetical protein